MAAILSLFIVLVVSLLITRTATVALTFTGLSRESARFQARSAFTGVGFTTSEAESVVNHPVRRRILMVLMLLGNAGIVTVVSSLVVTFAEMDTGQHPFRQILLLLTVIASMAAIARSRWVERQLGRFIAWGLQRWSTLDAVDYANLLHLAGEYGVAEIVIANGSWLADHSLQQLLLNREGVLVLGIQRRDGSYIGVPRSSTVIGVGDTVILYGRTPRLTKIEHRRCNEQGEACHQEGGRGARSSFRPGEPRCLAARRASGVRSTLRRPVGLRQSPLAEADRFRCHFHQFIVIDPFDCGLQTHRAMWADNHVFVATRSTHVGQFLLFANVDVEVVFSRILANHHPLVDRSTRWNEESATLLKVKNRIGDGGAFTIGNHRSVCPSLG